MIRKNKAFTERLKDAKRKNLLTLLDLLDIIINNKKATYIMSKTMQWRTGNSRKTSR